ncbi:hypothetical protein [Paludisphaera soli]|uniref:hypothetical protein n=1 Tax=Paludisphaera soli TaxID=2712865 RepID=UPI0013EB92A6|nr:hypothetical protein [Paludisphaera soli]
MNSTTSSHPQGSTVGSFHEGLEYLEGRLWDRARRNLRLLYNGGLATTSAPNQGPASRSLAVANPKI